MLINSGSVEFIPLPPLQNSAPQNHFTTPKWQAFPVRNNGRVSIRTIAWLNDTTVSHVMEMQGTQVNDCNVRFQPLHAALFCGAAGSRMPACAHAALFCGAAGSRMPAWAHVAMHAALFCGAAGSRMPAWAHVAALYLTWASACLIALPLSPRPLPPRIYTC